MIVRDEACELARARASCELDEELGEFDRRALARHLRRCDDCRSFAEAIGATTTLLQRDPLLPFSCGTGFIRRARSRYGLSLTSLVAALPVATAVVAGAIVLQFPGRVHRTPFETVPLQAPSTLLRVSPAVVGAAATTVPIRLPLGQRSARDEFFPETRTTAHIDRRRP